MLTAATRLSMRCLLGNWHRGAQAWWRIEGERVPPGDLPETRALRRLRSALRDMIEAPVDDRPAPKASVSELNFFMQSAPAAISSVQPCC